MPTKTLKSKEDSRFWEMLVDLCKDQQRTIQILSEALASQKSPRTVPQIMGVPGGTGRGPLTQEALEKIQAGLAERQGSSEEKPLPRPRRPGRKMIPHDFILPSLPGEKAKDSKGEELEHHKHLEAAKRARGE